jgi:hypothetical protein
MQIPPFKRPSRATVIAVAKIVFGILVDIGLHAARDKVKQTQTASETLGASNAPETKTPFTRAPASALRLTFGAIFLALGGIVMLFLLVAVAILLVGLALCLMAGAVVLALPLLISGGLAQLFFRCSRSLLFPRRTRK